MGNISKAQNLGIGPDVFDPHPSAGVEMRFTNKGLLIPRVALTSTSSASPITSPAASLLVYNTATAGDVTPGYYYWTGSKWMRLLAIDDKPAWLLSGNVATAANFIGTTNAIDFRIYTNNVERMTVEANGNVGIGTTSPSAKLHVVSTATQNLAYFYQTLNNYMYIKDTSATELLYAYKQQLTSKGDGQSTIYGYRTRNSQNDGTAYGVYTSNGAVKGYNLWGDLYSYGVGGFNYNDYTRCGGVLGAKNDGSYWASLGYKNSGDNTYGAYWTSSGPGTGYSATGSAMAGVGAGGYGDMLGLWSRGEVMGAIFSGELFSTYNLGNTYTSGTQVELVKTNNEKTPAYTMTSTKVKIYADGLGYLSGTEIFISYDNNFKKLLGDTTPIITITPIGKSANLYIKSIDKDGFIVACDTPQDIQFSWIAVGTRIDNKEVQRVPEELTDINFDNNLVDFMFNENIKERSAKAMWWDGSKIQFGKLPEFFQQADREAKQAELEKMKQLEENNNIKIDTEKKSK